MIAGARGGCGSTRDGDAAGFRVVGAARDVTAGAARRGGAARSSSARCSRRSASRASRMLTGGVAHDFNNLLAVILGNSRMALAETPPDSPLHARLARIRAAAEHGARLTEQMLAYSGKSSRRAEAARPLASRRARWRICCAPSVSERCRLELELGAARAGRRRRHAAPAGAC